MDQQFEEQLEQLTRLEQLNYHRRQLIHRQLEQVNYHHHRQFHRHRFWAAAKGHRQGDAVHEFCLEKCPSAPTGDALR